MMPERRPYILNVDDQDPERYIKTRDLTQAGFEVLEAKTGAEALKMIEHFRPPVVLLDVQLPDISGYEVCSYIKKKWPDVMVLQTSATFTTSEHRTRGLDHGADGYLVQPAEPVELAAAINALLRIHASEAAQRALNATLEQRVQDRTRDLAEANVRLIDEMTQRKKAEAQLVQSQKMEAVGQLTGGLAHDFNNLLTAVIGNIDMIKSRATDARIARWADNAFNAARRGSKLTAQLLAFSRTQQLETAPVDVNALIENMKDLLNQSLGASITVETRLQLGLPAALADANQLELAILNLAINARDAMPDGGTLMIVTAAEEVEPGAVVISIVDTGTGMSEETAAKAFDPFFTTKPPGKGTGLGLAQVFGIVRQLGGDVTIKSKLGEGTSVELRLLKSPVEASRGIATRTDMRRGHAERILIVDDDADVREIMTGVLSDLGYVVREAQHGEAAIGSLAEFSPNLVIVDFAMPGLNGAEVAVAVRKQNAGVPILFVSGFADTGSLEAAVGKAPLLRKPFRPAELAAAVRDALDGHH
jgi:DNA-binding response OmpR family regulator/anti-sigma regulatory factor (Ser/Thr protein kinase)